MCGVRGGSKGSLGSFGSREAILMTVGAALDQFKVRVGASLSCCRDVVIHPGNGVKLLSDNPVEM